MPVTLTSADPVAGLELHLKYDSEQLEFHGISSDLPGELTTNGTRDAIHIIWEDIFNVIESSNGDAVVYLRFELFGDTNSVTMTQAGVFNPEGLPYDIESINCGVTFSGKEKPLVPDNYSLRQNYTNSFNPTTTIELALPAASEYELEIYNIVGQLVRQYSGRGEPGVIRVVWDSRNSSGSALTSSIYLYCAKAESFSATKKMVLLK
jgi:hypothetical protein